MPMPFAAPLRAARDWSEAATTACSGSAPEWCRKPARPRPIRPSPSSWPPRRLRAAPNRLH